MLNYITQTSKIGFESVLYTFKTSRIRQKSRSDSVERNIIVAFAGMCPYLKDARSCERTICECARFTFPDKISRREILYKYCGHPTNWKNCTFKPVLDGFYERKYTEDLQGRQKTEQNKTGGKNESI